MLERTSALRQARPRLAAHAYLSWLAIASCSLCACEGGERSAGPHVDASTAAEAGAAIVGERAVAVLRSLARAPLDAAASAPARAISGTATFTVTASDVQLAILLRGCGASELLSVYIDEARSCAEAAENKRPWTRGETLMTVGCTAFGESRTMRGHTAALPWTIGGPSASDLLAHAVMVRDRNTDEPLACGEIARADALTPVDDDPSVAIEIKAQLSGLCTGRLITRGANRGCPDAQQLVECAAAQCDLHRCVRECGEFIACLSQASDVCANDCGIDEACSKCTSSLAQCTFSHCRELFECAPPPTPGGPCDELEACCARQRTNSVPCYLGLEQLKRLSGDPSCAGALVDWDFLTNIANDPPCRDIEL